MPAAAPAPRPAREPVDWELARRVAGRVAGSEPLAASYLGASLTRDFAEVTAQAERLVAEHTGLHAPGPARAVVLDRGEWVDANLDGMRRLLGPVTRRIAARRGSAVAVGARVAGTETGVLLGFLARRVLGQYDLLVPDGADAGEAVWYVGPNVLALEKRHVLPPRQFRLWIAIHEVTHRAQFSGVPWLRGYFLDLVQRALDLVDPEPARLGHAIGRVADHLRHGRSPIDEGGLVALLASPEERTVLDRIQALMSLLEGHGNAVMHELGVRHVPQEGRMRRLLQSRRDARGPAALLQRLFGLELKMRQYAVGEAFVAGVTRLGGPRAIDAAWARPEHLPTHAELADPAAWLARVDGALARPATAG